MTKWPAFVVVDLNMLLAIVATAVGPPPDSIGWAVVVCALRSGVRFMLFALILARIQNS